MLKNFLSKIQNRETKQTLPLMLIHFLPALPLPWKRNAFGWWRQGGRWACVLHCCVRASSLHRGTRADRHGTARRRRRYGGRSQELSFLPSPAAGDDVADHHTPALARSARGSWGYSPRAGRRGRGMRTRGARPGPGPPGKVSSRSRGLDAVSSSSWLGDRELVLQVQASRSIDRAPALPGQNSDRRLMTVDSSVKKNYIW